MIQFRAGPSSCCAHASPRFVLSDARRHYERDRPFRITHLALLLELFPETRSVRGVARLDFERVGHFSDQLLLDAVGFSIETCRLVSEDQEIPVDFSYDGERLSVPLARELSVGCLEVSYRTTPTRGLTFLEPDHASPERPRQVWSQCQDEDARHFFPCHDAPHMKCTTEVTLTVPEGWLAFSNGTCLEISLPSEGVPRTTYHYRLDVPHPSYLVTVVAGSFTVLEDRPVQLPSGRKIAVRYVVPPGKEEEGWRTFAETRNMLELFGKLTGVEYPYDSYTQIVVADFVFGGMENTTATTLYEHVLLDQRARLDIHMEDLIAHELAHHWFGDLVTCRDWSEAWLNEGFATYFEHLEREARLGPHGYLRGVLGDLEQYLAESSTRYDRPLVCRDYRDPIELFDRHLYEKGALVLHMLRRLLGDPPFFAALRTYLETHRCGVVQTVDLLRALEETSGRSLGRFFDEWVFGSGYPEFEVTAEWEAELLTVSLTQEPRGGATGPFAVPFQVQVGLKGGSCVELRTTLTEKTTALTLRTSERPSFLAFDPELCIAAPIRLKWTADFSIGCLLSARSVRSRLLAAQALSTRHDQPSLEALTKILDDVSEPFVLRAECAKCLGRAPYSGRLEALLRALGTDRPEVRRAAASALGRFRDPRVRAALARAAESDPSYLVCAEAARSLGRLGQPDTASQLLPLLEVTSWADSVRAGALDGLAELHLPALIPLFVEHAQPGRPTRGRRAAVAALARFTREPVVLRHLEPLLDDADPHLRMEVTAGLLNLGLPEARAVLLAREAIETDGRVLRSLREALREQSASARDSERRFADQLEELRTKLAELEGRLARSHGEKPSPTGSPEAPPSHQPKLPRKSRVGGAQPKKKAPPHSRGTRAGTGTRSGAATRARPPARRKAPR